MQQIYKKWSDLELQQKKYYIIGYAQDSLTDSEMNEFFEWYCTPEYVEEMDKMLDEFQKVSEFVEAELEAFEIKYQKKNAKKSFLFSYQYKWAIAAAIVMIVVVTLWFLIDKKSEKNKEKEFVKKQENQQNINPKTTKDSLINPKDNVVEKEQNQEKVVPKKEKIDDLYVDNFISNKAIESKMLAYKSIAKTITFILPKSNNENFDKLVIFDFKDANKEIQNYTLEIITNQEIEVYKKVFKLNELPLSVDFSKNEPGVYYFFLKTDNNPDDKHVGRFFFKKK